MSKLAEVGIEVNVDPLDSFSGVKKSKLFEATGLIPYFVGQAALCAEDADTAAEVMEVMNECYGFGLGDYNMLDSGGGKVAEDGLYTYPEDPDMAPLVEFKLPQDVTVWVYQYGIVAVRDAVGHTIMQRMD